MLNSDFTCIVYFVNDVFFIESFKLDGTRI